MNFKNPIRFAAMFAALFVFTGIAAAQTTGPVVDSDTTSSNLAMAAEVETTLQLNISTGTGGATVNGSNATGLFTLDFGTLNGFGSMAGSSDNVLGTPDGIVGALYTTPINLTPVFTGFAAETATVVVDLGGSDDDLLAREGATAATTSAAFPHGAFSGAISGSDNERVVGLYISRTEVGGTKEATLVYTITIQ